MDVKFIKVYDRYKDIYYELQNKIIEYVDCKGLNNIALTDDIMYCWSAFRVANYADEYQLSKCDVIVEDISLRLSLKGVPDKKIETYIEYFVPTEYIDLSDKILTVLTNSFNNIICDNCDNDRYLKMYEIFNIACLCKIKGNNDLADTCIDYVNMLLYTNSGYYDKIDIDDTIKYIDVDCEDSKIKDDLFYTTN